MARRRKNQQEEVTTTEKKQPRDSRNFLSDAAMEALSKGTYGEKYGRTAQYKTSQEQTQQQKALPVLEGMNSQNGTFESKLGRNNRIDPERARKSYAERNNYEPIGTSLDQDDADTLYKIFDKNRLSSGGNSAIVHQLKNNIWLNTKDWEKKYGKSLEQIVDDYSKDFDKIAERKNQEKGEGNKLLSTLGNVFRGGTVEPALDLESTILGKIAPNTELTKAVRNATEKYSKQKSQVKEGVTSDMTDKGKQAYDIATNVAERTLEYSNPSKLKYLLQGGKTAEESRQSLKERGIEGLGAELQSLGAGTVDALLDMVGFEKIPALKKLSESGSLGKELAGRFLIGGGEQGLTETINRAIDRLNGDDSLYEQAVQNYMAQGMSEKDARKQANLDDLTQIKNSAITGGLIGDVLGLGGKAVKKAFELPKLKGMNAEPTSEVPKTETPKSSETDNIIPINRQKVPDSENIMPQNGNTPTESPNAGRLKEIDDSLAQIDEKLKQYGGSENNADAEKYHADIRAIDEQLERLKDGILPYEELIKSSTNIPEALQDLYSQRAMLLTQFDQIQDGMTTTLPSGKQHRLTAQELADHRANIRYLIKQTDNQIVDNTNKFLRMARETARNNLENASEPIEDALTGNVKRQLEQTRERLLQERQSLQTGGGNTLPQNPIDNVPPQKPPMPPEDVNGGGRPPIPPRNGDIDEGNVPPNGGDVPPNNGGNGNVPPESPFNPDNPANELSRRYETLKKSPLFTQSEANMKLLENAKEAGVFDKGIEGRRQAQDQALKEYTADPEKAINELADKKEWSGKDMDMSMLILQDALDSGSQAWANMTLLKQVKQSKSAGRQLRALRDYAYSGTKEGTLSKATDYLLDKADQILSSKKNSDKIKSMAESVSRGDFSVLKNMDDANIRNIKDALDNGASLDDIVTMLAMHEAVGKTGISPETINKVTELYKQIETLPPTSKAKADVESDIFKILAQDIGGKRTAKEMWDSWRYLAMLGNPKTHLRNILGNTTHRMVTEVKDNVGAIMEGIVDNANRANGGEGIERTKALLGVGDKGLIDASAKDADDVAYAALNDMKQKYNVKDEIGRAVDSFNNKTLSKIDEFNSTLLEKEDYSALKKKYSKSLARFLKANGADESIFNATDDASKALLDKARTYAIDQAKQATFHEYSLMADKLSQLSKGLQESGKARHKAASWVLEGLVPFKKTPINILKQGSKYSPISLVKGVGKMLDAVKTGNSSASDAIEDFASGLTGTGIMALGAFLANQGILTGGANENYDVDNAETMQGKQNYALQIGDKSYTLDWLAPMSLPLFVGAELMNMFSEDGGDETSALDKVIQSVSTIAEPVTEMSMLQGIQNVLNELSYSTENAIAALGANTTLGYLSQGIPTLAGQFARAIDDTRRSTYTDKPQGFMRQFDKAITKDINKIPFLSTSNEAYIDAKGQENQNEGLATALFGNNFGTRLMDQMLSPGYYKEGNVTDVDKELNRLYDETGENVYMNVASGKVNNEKLSKEKFTEYQKLYGQNNEKLYNAIVNSPEYNSMDDSQRVELINDIKKFSKLIADHEVGGKELTKSDQTKYDIYKEKGIDGVIDYYKENAKAKALGMKYSDYVKKEQEYDGGAEQYAQDKQTAEELGFVNKDGKVNTDQYKKAIEQAGAQSQKFINDLPALEGMGLQKSAYYKYANAINVIPSLTPDEFVQDFNEIDTNSNGGITQKELLDFINSFEYDDPSEAEELWYAYGGFAKKDGTPKKLVWDGKKFVGKY